MKISGTGSALPKQVVTNDMLAQFLDTSDEWIKTRTGVSSRFVISDEKLEDLASNAAQKALEDAGIKAEELDFIICSNVVNAKPTTTSNGIKRLNKLKALRLRIRPWV